LPLPRLATAGRFGIVCAKAVTLSNSSNEARRNGWASPKVHPSLGNPPGERYGLIARSTLDAPFGRAPTRGRNRFSVAENQVGGGSRYRPRVLLRHRRVTADHGGRLSAHRGSRRRTARGRTPLRVRTRGDRTRHRTNAFARPTVQA